MAAFSTRASHRNWLFMGPLPVRDANLDALLKDFHVNQPGSDRPLERPYARVERERRFLLSSLPLFLNPDEFEWIEDRYLLNTRCRLRKVYSPTGAIKSVKLSQKRACTEHLDCPYHTAMTTFYLEPDEAVAFEQLPARSLRKRRYYCIEQGWTFAIDWIPVGAETALVLCEVECDSDDDLLSIQLPTWCEREITTEARFSGWELAGSAELGSLGRLSQQSDGQA